MGTKKDSFKLRIFRFLTRKKIDINGYCRRKWADYAFEERFGRTIDWNHPRDLNEFINFFEHCTDTSIWSPLSDKIAVRDYVKDKGLEHILIPLLGVWNDARDIDFDQLPEKFVLKCNHDSGSTHIIDKSKGFDKGYVIADLNNHLSKKFGEECNEPHYNRISPKVLAEEFISFECSTEISSSPIDYKIWCFNGIPDVICVYYNRSKSNVCYEIRDIEWRLCPEYAVGDEHFILGSGTVPEPKALKEMLEYAKVLSEGFPELRVDFYEVSGKVYFGELTFTSSCGRMTSFSEKYLTRAAQLIRKNM